MVSITVSDTGTGIPKELLPRVFERKLTGTKGGAGLGLHICKEIIKAHGGEISVKNGLESGVDVQFTLPLADDGGTND
jgi:signal transduction histidine kinase